MASLKRYAINCNRSCAHILNEKSNIVFVGDSKTENSAGKGNITNSAFGEWPLNWTGYWTFAKMTGGASFGCYSTVTLATNHAALSAAGNFEPPVVMSSTGLNNNIAWPVSELVFGNAMGAADTFFKYEFGATDNNTSATLGAISVKHSIRGNWFGRSMTARCLFLNSGTNGAADLQIKYGRGTNATVGSATTTGITSAGTNGTYGYTDVTIADTAAGTGLNQQGCVIWQNTTASANDGKYFTPLGVYLFRSSTEAQQARCTQLACSSKRTADYLDPDSAVAIEIDTSGYSPCGIIENAAAQRWFEAQFGTNPTDAPTVYIVNLGTNKLLSAQLTDTAYRDHNGTTYTDRYGVELKAVADRLVAISTAMGNPNAKVIFVTDFIGTTESDASIDSAQAQILSVSNANPTYIGVIDVWQFIKDNITSALFKSPTTSAVNGFSYDGVHGSYPYQEWWGRITYAIMADTLNIAELPDSNDVVIRAPYDPRLNANSMIRVDHVITQTGTPDQ